MAKIKYVARLNGQIVGTRTSERSYSHAIVVNGHGKTDIVATWCGRFDLAQGEQRKYARYGYRAEIVAAERLEPKAKPAGKVDAIAKPAEDPAPAPAAEAAAIDAELRARVNAAPELNAQQQRTVDRIRALIIKNKSLGQPEAREFKQFEITGGSTGLVFLLTEYGSKTDEGTAAALICRDRRFFQIGKAGGVQLLSFAGNLRTSTPKNVRGIFNSVNFYHAADKAPRKAKAAKVAAPAIVEAVELEAPIAATAPAASIGYPVPFQFAIEAGRPLLVMSCSDVKADVGDRLVRFADLYDGPMWRQVKGSGFPMTNVAAVSALHGFLEPGIAIRSYDRKMDAEISERICSTSNHVALLVRAIRAAGSAFIVGGGLYQELARRAVRICPELADVVTFACGSYLAQRKQLGEWLRAQAAIGAAEDLEAAALDPRISAHRGRVFGQPVYSARIPGGVVQGSLERVQAALAAADLKASLDRGALVKVGNRDGVPLAEAFAQDGRYQFRGLTGRHSLDCSCSDAERLAAHWETFVQANVEYADRLDREAADRAAA